MVLSASQGASVDRYVHAIRGIHAQKDASGNWEWLAQDGLGSVREVVDHSGSLLWMTHYADFGSGFGSVGAAQTVYGFTGEMLDGGGLLDLRARSRD
ncbi:MAG: hypothetical protein JNM70_00065 [Anaerolineae bacterium]|nr:hypothetical protein [Anaerolineae bacterium]